MHANELPLRKLIELVDGKTTGPLTSRGQIAGMLEFDPQDKPVVEFCSLSGCVVEVEDMVMNDLSTDQLYLLRICLLTQRGYHTNENHISYLQTAQPRWYNQSCQMAD